MQVITSLLALGILSNIHAFIPSTNAKWQLTESLLPLSLPPRQLHTTILHSVKEGDDEDYEYAMLRRRQKGNKKYYDDNNDADTTSDGKVDDRYESSAYSSDSSTTQGSTTGDKSSYYDELYDDYDVNIDDEYDDDEYDYEDDDDEEYGVFSNVVIPNPILDSIDPDGAADRFPELARDPRFWFDMLLFVAFLDFLSAVGPRDPFPDIPMY